MRRTWTLVLVLLAVVASGCRSTDLTLESADPDTGRTDRPVPAGEVVTDPDEVVLLALDDVEAFWAERLPDLYGVELEPLRGGRVPYGPTSPLRECGELPVDYEEIAENALYCPAEDLIAWDRVNLIPPLQDDFGSLTVGIVMAHEYGHAVQERGDVRGATVVLELQADCFAGAWVADVDDRLATFATSADALDSALAGLLELRDAVGVDKNDPNAHGTGFDRIGAFQDGFEDGVEACAAYEDDPPPVVAIPFSPGDLQTGGNLPLDDLIPPLVEDLEQFWTALFAELGGTWDSIDGGLQAVDPSTDRIDCGDEVLEGAELQLASFYCVADDTIYLDAVDLVPALEEIGDFAFGGEVARNYAIAAQEQLGVVGTPAAVGLHADCLTGVYAGAEFAETIPEQVLSLSPGDLDEIIIAFLAFADVDEATAFERTAAFRSGFVEGVGSCEALLG